MKTSLTYANEACDVIIKKFIPEDLPPKHRFHYHQGVFLSGMQNVYHLTRDEKYYDYIKSWVDTKIHSDGRIDFYPDELDDLQPGILLFDIYKRSGDEKYKKALDIFIGLLKKWRLNDEGGFWHKAVYPNQMWLDSMYMAGPLMSMYGREFGCEELFDIVYRQMKLMKIHNRDKKTGLFYHAWDASKKEDWADKNSGVSEFFWGRAIGWYGVAMFDIAEHIPPSHPLRKEFIDTGLELIDTIIKYQNKEDMWCQVVDRIDDTRNWSEVSCSCLFIYTICKAINMGFLDDKYKVYAKKAYDAVISTISYNESGIMINNVCIGTCVGDYEHYLNRPTSTNDLHGMGAFILMCCEYFKLFNE